MPDQHKNFAYSTVATAPSPATSGTSLVVASGDGAKFPIAPFNATVWPASSQPTAANAEIMRVTAISTDTLTLVRAQESSSARSIGVGDQIAATVTAKTLTDAEVQLASTTRIYEEFAAGTPLWQFGSGGTGSSASRDQPQLGAPGCARMIIGANASVYAFVASNNSNNTADFHQSDQWDLEIRYKTPSVITDSDQRSGVVQYNNITAFPPSGSGVYFEHLAADTDWFVVLRSGSSQNRTDTGQAVAASTWYRLRLFYDGTDMWYSINGGTPVNVGHTNYPATNLVAQASIAATSAPAASRTANVDYCDLHFTGLSR